MWKILNRIFGWDYISWKNSADQGVARVYTDGIGRAWYWRYKGTACCDVISEAKQVIWLTCEPSKYMKEAANDE